MTAAAFPYDSRPLISEKTLPLACRVLTKFSSFSLSASTSLPYPCPSLNLFLAEKWHSLAVRQEAEADVSVIIKSISVFDVDFNNFEKAGESIVFDTKKSFL